MSRIRIAVVSDIPFVSQCARAAYEVYIDRIGREPAPMVADFKTHIKDGDVHIFESPDSTRCGFVIFRQIDNHVLLENVAVHPSQHGKGYGKKLIGFVEEFARSQRIRTVQLYTNLHMRENLSLYPALGYRETGRRSEDGFNRVYFEKIVDRE